MNNGAEQQFKLFCKSLDSAVGTCQQSSFALIQKTEEQA